MRTASTIFRRTLLIITVAALAVVLTACRGGAGSGSDHKESEKGAGKGMNTYYIGRFSIDVPAEMQEAARTHRLRYAEIEEFIWPQDVEREKARVDAWNKRVAEINALTPPKKVKKVVIKTIDISDIGKWAKVVIYHGDSMDNEVAKINLLADMGDTGLLIRSDNAIWNSSNEIKMINNVKRIAGSYFNFDSIDKYKAIKQNIFAIRYGALDIPYLRDESSYVRFEGHPLDLTLEIEMTETHSVEETGLVDRLKTAIATNFAPTVDVKQVRARKRTVAGLPGEEIVSIMSDKDGTIIDFGWEYAGKEDSGEHPEIQIIMEAPEGKLDEKLRIWDSILDSMKPLYR